MGRKTKVGGARREEGVLLKGEMAVEAAMQLLVEYGFREPDTDGDKDACSRYSIF